MLRYRIDNAWKIFLFNLRLLKTRQWLPYRFKVKARYLLENLFYIFYHNSSCLRKIFPLHLRIKQSFPSYVMIETASFCNARCIVCPAYEASGNLPQGEMPLELYRNIIDECSRHKILEIFPYLTNEPLMDKDIIARLSYTKEKMPRTRMFLSTNCSLLNPDMTHQLLKYVDVFVFSVFAITRQDYKIRMPGLDYDKVMENIDYLLKFRRLNRLKNIAVVRHLVSRDELLRKGCMEKLKKIFCFWKEKGIFCRFDLFYSRAGNAPESCYYKKRPGHNTYPRYCWLNNSPLKFIHIIFNGDVVLCCMDCRREVILGNVNKTSISEIWNGGLYNNIRDRIYSDNNREGYDDDFLCNRCINPYFN